MPLLIGHDRRCDIVVSGESVDNRHAVIEYHPLQETGGPAGDTAVSTECASSEHA